MMPQMITATRLRVKQALNAGRNPLSGQFHVSSPSAHFGKQMPGKGVFVGGVKLPLALAELDLIDEYEFVVQPRLAGHGATLFAGLSKYVDLKLVSRREFGSGAVALRYVPRR